MPETQPVDRSFRFCIFLKVPGDLLLPPAASQIRPKIRPQKKIKERSQKGSPRAPFGASWAFKIKQKLFNRLSKAPPCAGPEKVRKLLPPTCLGKFKKLFSRRNDCQNPHVGRIEKCPEASFGSSFGRLLGGFSKPWGKQKPSPQPSGTLPKNNAKSATPKT